MDPFDNIIPFPLGNHRNVIDFQRAARIKHIERQITADNAAGYPTDHLLDLRSMLVEEIRKGPCS